MLLVLVTLVKLAVLAVLTKKTVLKSARGKGLAPPTPVGGGMARWEGGGEMERARRK